MPFLFFSENFIHSYIHLVIELFAVVRIGRKKSKDFCRNLELTRKGSLDLYSRVWVLKIASFEGSGYLGCVKKNQTFHPNTTCRTKDDMMQEQNIDMRHEKYLTSISMDIMILDQYFEANTL